MTAVGEGLAANLASEASKGLFAIAKRHAGYCFHFRKYVEDFQTELKNLESTRNDAAERETSARENNEEITEVAMNWLGKANDLINAAEKLKEKTEEHSKCLIGCCPNCIRQYGLGKKAAKMTPELNKQNADFIYDNFSRPAPRLGMEFYAPMNFVDLESRKVAHDQLWKALQDDQMLRIGVYAMGGLGKTTLVKKLGYKVENEKLFGKVVFVVVSNPPDIRRIQENIASQLGLEFRNNEESDRAREMWLRLTNGEKILIILDDVWDKLDFSAIGIPFDEKHKGCRVLLTTRKVDVCTSLDCQTNIQLSVLSEKDSWKLFQMYANISNDPSISLDVAKKIASECKGLPVAIAVVASMLKGNAPEEWEQALTTLENAEPLIGVDEKLEEIYKCLRLSYANLKSKEAQELFLLCSFFPEDYEIPVEDLTRYAIGLHMFGEDRSFTKARMLALKAKRTLIDSCLLLNVETSRNERVKMHDLVREVAQWIANNEIKVIMGSKFDKDALDRVRYLWLHNVTDLPNQFNSPRLEVLMILANIEGCDNISFEGNEEFFKGSDNLRVLTLSFEVYFYPRFSIKLPVSIKALKCLRILRINGWKLGDISIIGSLSSLEIVELCACEINELPNGMVELKNLKLLNLSYSIILQNPFGVIGRFMQLEELYCSFMKSTWEVNGDNISDFLPENCQLKRLRRYRIQIGTNLRITIDGRISTCLSIDRFHPSTSNETIKNLVQRAEVIGLRQIKGGYRNIVPDVVGAVGGNIQWTCMELYSWEDIECLIDYSRNVSSQDDAISMLSALVVLSMSQMRDLKELCHGTPPSSSSGILEKLRTIELRLCPLLSGILFGGNLNLQSLKFVTLVNCPMLTSLFTMSVAQSLEQLEGLRIRECNRVEHIIAYDENDDDQKLLSSSSGCSIFQKLKRVEIEKCDSLKFIFPACLAERLVQLEEIYIDGAAELKHVFGHYQDDEGKQPLHHNDREIMLPSLQEIELNEVPCFNSIFPIYSHPKDYPEATSLEATTSVDIHSSSQTHAAKWYMSGVQCLPKKLANLCHIKYGFQDKDTALDATSTKELHSSQNIDPKLLPQVSTIQHCLSRQLLNMCNIIEISLRSLPTTVASLFTLSTAQKMTVKELVIRKCHGLKHIVTSREEVDLDHKSFISIFPELQNLKVEGCNLLEFVFPGCSAQCPVKLETLTLEDAPELKSVFGQCYRDNHLSHHQNENMNMELCALKKVYLNNCPQLRTKSIKDFVFCSDAMEPDCFTTKAILRHDNMLNVQVIEFERSEVEGIFLMEKEQEDQLISRLEELKLTDLPELRYISMAPPQCLSFHNLHNLKVIGCGKLSCIFPISVARSLPQLNRLEIENCDELERLVEEDHIEISQDICFPNLTGIFISRCNNLKYLFFISHPDEFPKLYDLSIEEASQLEEVFRWGMGETQRRVNTMLPELTELLLRKLPCLTNICQGLNLEIIGKASINNCPKLPPEYGNEDLDSSVEGSDIMDQEETSDLDFAESSTINQKETGDTAPRNLSSISGDTYPLAAPETCTTPAISLNEKIQESSSNPFAVPPSSNFSSGTSGDSRTESSTSATPIKEVDEGGGVIGQFTVSGESKVATPQAFTDQAIIIEDALVEEGIVKNDPVISEHPMVDVNPPHVHSPFIGEALVHLHSPNTLMEHECMKGRSKEAIQQEGSEHEEEEEKKGDGVDQTSSDFPSGTSGDMPKELYPLAAPQTCTIQSISMIEKIRDSNSSLLVYPASSSFPSGSSGDARNELSTTGKQYDVTPIKKSDGEKVVIEQFTASGESRYPINMNENIDGSNVNPLAVPPSPDSTSSTLAAPSSTASPLEDEPQKSSAAASAEQHNMTPFEEYAAFRDIGLIKKKNIPLLEQAIEIYPSLWTWRNRYKHSRMKQIGYSNLGDMLEFLATTRWRDLTEEKKAEFESLVEVMKSLDFDIQWLDSTIARIKESKIDEGTINQLKTLQVKKAELEAHLHKVKMELSELGNLDDFCLVDSLPS
ncbi:hypothetical protein RIF29_41442 [Crotalaria pallida]|uniref:NB-ARC domain-containing protein n=1 Tax=Crotalaria pallida TaxID=3830 RepID=A0AAN9HVA5_CROPI